MFNEEQQAYFDAKLKEALDSQAGKLKAEFDGAITGLKNTNQALKDEKLEEIAAKERLELESAKKAGDFEKQLEIANATAAKTQEDLQSQLNARDNLLIGNDNELAVSGLASHMINNDPATHRLLSTMTTSGLGDDGKVVRSYIDFDGNQVATDEKGFIEWAGKNETMRNYLKGSDATGGEASGNSGQQQAPNVNERAEAAKKSNDLGGFLAASMSQQS
jgi:regulatory protein YycH of two-component signal transduction system YycFG